MRPLFFALGAVLLSVAAIDATWTTLWVERGGGPVSSRLMAGLWRGLRTVAGDRSTVLSLAGPLLVILTLVTWVGLLWAGWTFVFASGENALVDTQGSSITWYDLGYFVAYTIFTLGIGDIIPADGRWQIATVLTTATGMFFITMGVSYVISVVGAVSRKRSFASGVTALGMHGGQFVQTGWTGESFEGFELLLDSLAEEVDYLAYQYKAYPILHYYHTVPDEHAPALGIAIFDEALTLLQFGIPEEHQPNTALVESARASTQNYLKTLGAGFIRPADRTPPPPDLDRLRDAGIPTVSDEEFADALADLDEHRRELLGMVESDARDWPRPED